MTGRTHPLLEERVGPLLRRAPEAARVFLDRRMQCPACLLAPFVTVAEAARAYGAAPAGLAEDLRRALPEAER